MKITWRAEPSLGGTWDWSGSFPAFRFCGLLCFLSSLNHPIGQGTHDTGQNNPHLKLLYATGWPDLQVVVTGRNAKNIQQKKPTVCNQIKLYSPDIPRQQRLVGHLPWWEQVPQVPHSDLLFRLVMKWLLWHFLAIYFRDPVENNLGFLQLSFQYQPARRFPGDAAEENILLFVSDYHWNLATKLGTSLGQPNLAAFLGTWIPQERAFHAFQLIFASQTLH